jgi:hypothetical protein
MALTNHRDVSSNVGMDGGRKKKRKEKKLLFSTTTNYGRFSFSPDYKPREKKEVGRNNERKRREFQELAAKAHCIILFFGRE